jgi:hypothetical protein
MKPTSRTTYFLYDRIPGCWHGWMLAVLAVGRRDADTYMRNVHHGGTFIQQIMTGDVKADCGAITEAAQAILHAHMEELMP